MGVKAGVLPRWRKIQLGSVAKARRVAVDLSQPASMPNEITELVGATFSVSQPMQGYCGTVLFLHADQRDYVLKIAEGRYRGSELQAEHAALLCYHQMADPAIPVAQPYTFVQQANLYYLLTSRCEGEPVDQVLATQDARRRNEIIGHMGRMLAAIHDSQTITDEDWHSCLREQLRFAEWHLEDGSLDPDEFNGQGQPMEPAVLLRRLRDQTPEAGRVCVLHGDYRPKNLLWHAQDRRISAVLDWAFCDIGDPYYDLAIVMYYMRNEEERRVFLYHYGIRRVDEQRLRYFEDLSKFINV